MASKKSAAKPAYNRSEAAKARKRDASGHFIPQDKVREMVKKPGTSVKEAAENARRNAKVLGVSAKSLSKKSTRRQRRNKKHNERIQRPRNTEERRIAAEKQAEFEKRSAAGKKAAATRAAKQAEAEREKTRIAMARAIILTPADDLPCDVVAPIKVRSTEGVGVLQAITGDTSKRPMVEQFVRARAVGHRVEATERTQKLFGFFTRRYLEHKHIVIIELPTGDVKEVLMNRVYKIQE